MQNTFYKRLWAIEFKINLSLSLFSLDSLGVAPGFCMWWLPCELYLFHCSCCATTIPTPAFPRCLPMTHGTSSSCFSSPSPMATAHRYLWRMVQSEYWAMLLLAFIGLLLLLVEMNSIKFRKEKGHYDIFWHCLFFSAMQCYLKFYGTFV